MWVTVQTTEWGNLKTWPGNGWIGCLGRLRPYGNFSYFRVTFNFPTRYSTTFLIKIGKLQVSIAIIAKSGRNLSVVSKKNWTVWRGNLPEVPTFNFKLAKSCRHAGTVRSPLSEYRLTLPSVVMALPPTVIRSLSEKKLELRERFSEVKLILQNFLGFYRAPTITEPCH